MYELLIHQWKEKLRSVLWQRNIVLNIFLAFLGILLLFYALLVGFFADVMILKIYKESNVVNKFNGLLFYYFTIEIIARFLFQSLPTLSIQPYLTLPIEKNKLLHYPLIKSVFSLFNVMAILLFIPFFLKVIITSQTVFYGVVWLTTVLSLITINNFLSYSIKKYFLIRPFFVLLLLVGVGGLIWLENQEIVTISKYFSRIFIYLGNMPFLAVIPIGLAVLSYVFTYNLLRKNSYIEDSISKDVKTNGNFSFLGKYGEIGQLLTIELKLILRNNRPRGVLYFSLFSLAYGFIFYRDKNLDNHLAMSFIGVLMPSLFSLQYGQMFFSWESSFFDCFRSNRIRTLNYIKSKYFFYVVTTVIGFVITLPYILIDYRIGWINLAFLFYNIGVNSLVLIFISTFNKSYIDLGKSIFMNYQGTSFVQFLVLIPTMGIPFIMNLLCDYLGAANYYYWIMATFGLLGILLSGNMFQLIVAQFDKRKHKMSAGFKER